MSVKDELLSYYSKKSKHSNYQVLPDSLRAILGKDEVQTKTRFERERLRYITEKVELTGKTILDIGGNTGFFTIELVDAGAKASHCYEGNKKHADFVRLAAKALNLDNVQVTNQYFSFDGGHDERYDIVLLLNVLHHVGDDYGDRGLSIQGARKNIIKQLKSLKDITGTVVFQLGFNWQGDPGQCLFEQGTKREMIEYIKTGVEDTWDIAAIGVAESTGNGIVYVDLNQDNIERDDSLGEFLNRPLFILSKSSSSNG